ncbi:MAG: hypothetical protein JXB88_00945 [Spirochaetales bacterium]|nr:hypothetical protein [Spirochaetales bacterium]
MIDFIQLLQQLLQHPVIRTILSVILPVLIIPFLMRLIVGRIILFRVKKKYLPAYLESIYSGWESEDDKKAMKEVSRLALQRLKYHFIFKPEFFADAKAILISIKNIYNQKKSEDDYIFTFSLLSLIECSLLAFSDIYKEYGKKPWFRLIQNVKLIWFYRAWNFRKIYMIIFTNPVIDRLRRTRILGKLLRILLIPLLGIPSLIFYIIRSIVISIFLESFFRFFYALILMKFGYYALYLYGKENTQISKRIKDIPKKKLGELNKQIQEMILPSGWENKSDFFQQAVESYLEVLKTSGIPMDQEVMMADQSFLDKTKGVLTRVTTAFKRAYKKHNPLDKKEESDKDKILKFYGEISRQYVPKARIPYTYLRLKELIAAGYMASVMILHKILSTPGAKLLLDKISGNFAVKLTSAVKDSNLLKVGVKGIKGAYKYYKLYRIGSRAFKVLRGIASPYTLIWTFGSPVLFQQLQDLLREYTAHRIGRLILFTWESHKLKKKSSLHPLLW